MLEFQIMKRLIAIVSALFLILSLQGQTKQAIIHTNQPYYVTGETMWFRINLPKGFTGIKGKAKVIIKGSTNNVIGDFFVEQADLAINGYFKIPFSASSDLYNVAVYVLENQTLNPIRLLNFDVPIYNDLEAGALIPVFPESSKRNKAEIDVASHLQFNVNLSQNNYSIGDEVRLEAQVLDASGKPVPAEFSVSVIDEGLLGSSTNDYCMFSTDIDLGVNTVIGMDDRLFVQGKVYNAESDSPTAISIMGAFTSKTNEMHFGKSRSDGNFTVLIPEKKGAQNLQLVGYLYDEVPNTKVELFSGEPLDRDGLQFTNAFDADVTQYIDASNQRKRIYQQFKTLENNAVFEPIENKRLEVRPNKTFRMDEYVEFETVGVFFDEIFGAQLTFEKEGEVYKAKMFNPRKNRSSSAMQNFYFKLDPIFIVDGKMTKDADYIYRMPLDQVDEINLYFDWRDIEKQFGLFGDFGYVVIRSRKGGISLPPADEDDILKINGYQPLPDYPVTIAKDDSGLPQLRPNVFWHPSLKSSGNTQKGKVSFLASDDISKFKVLVMARTADGNVLTKQVSYTSSIEK